MVEDEVKFMSTKLMSYDEHFAYYTKLMPKVTL